MNSTKGKEFKGELDIADFDIGTAKEHKVKLTRNPTSEMKDDPDAYILCTLKGTRFEPEG